MRIILRTLTKREKKPNWQGIAKEVELALDTKVAPKLREYGERVTANWEHRPKWVLRKSVDRGGIRVYMTPATNADIWTYVSRGTKAHVIRPRKKPMLVFPTGYVPKTTPSGPSYGGPGKASGPTVYAMEVHHPGNKGRLFEEAFARWIKPIFEREVKAAIQRGARKA